MVLMCWKVLTSGLKAGQGLRFRELAPEMQLVSWSSTCISAVTVTLSFFMVMSINVFINSSERNKPSWQKNYVSISMYALTY